MVMEVVSSNILVINEPKLALCKHPVDPNDHGDDIIRE
jgi:hypothetical protein